VRKRKVRKRIRESGFKNHNYTHTHTHTHMAQRSQLYVWQYELIQNKMLFSEQVYNGALFY
jgi:hypothetical protein